MSSHPATIGIVDLKITNDVAGELNLTLPMFKVLDMLAKAGGELPFAWDKILPASRELLADMIDAGLVLDHPIIGRRADECLLRMTDKGRNVLDKHRQSKVVAGDVKPVEIVPA